MEGLFDLFDGSVDKVGVYNVVCDKCGYKVVVVTPDDEDVYECSNCNCEVKLTKDNLVSIKNRCD